MKYKVLYECRLGDQSFKSEFEMEYQSTPKVTDSRLIELALKHSAEFHKSGQGGIKILDQQNNLRDLA